VGITSPSSGATGIGDGTVTASASDNVGVAGVQFLVDGAALGAEDRGPVTRLLEHYKPRHGSHT